MAESLVERSAIQPDGLIMLLSHPEQGKFIRIHFGPSGKLAGADIETCEYLTRHILEATPAHIFGQEIITQLILHS